MIKLAKNINAKDPKIVLFDKFANWFYVIAIIISLASAAWAIARIVSGNSTASGAGFIVVLAIPIGLFLNSFWDLSSGIFGFQGFTFPPPQDKMINYQLHLAIGIFGMILTIALLGIQLLLSLVVGSK